MSAAMLVPLQANTKHITHLTFSTACQVEDTELREVSRLEFKLGNAHMTWLMQSVSGWSERVAQAVHDVASARPKGVGVVQVEGKNGKSITPQYLADMQYGDATVKEVLRLAAIINNIPKRALTTFELCGYTIPEVCAVEMHDAQPLWAMLQPVWQHTAVGQ